MSSQSAPIETEETVETSVGGGKHANDEDFEDDREPYEEEDETDYLRKKRSTKKQKHRRQLPESVRRKLREQRAEMKEAVRLAKEAGAATEYRGSLRPSELVSVHEWSWIKHACLEL